MDIAQTSAEGTPGGTPSAPGNQPFRYLLSNYQLYRQKCLPLHMAALNGDVDAAKRLIRDNPAERLLDKAITQKDETVFHVAVGAKQVKFVKEMVELFGNDAGPLQLKDQDGNTAFCYAAAAGTKQIAKILLRRSENLLTIRGFNEYTPLYISALFGQRDMASFLNWKIENLRKGGRDMLTEVDRKKIFFISIHHGLYDLALKMLKLDMSLAVATEDDGMTALHLLANTPSAFTSESSGSLKMLKNFLISVVPAGMNSAAHESNSPTHALELVNVLWEEILSEKYSEIVQFIRAHRNLLFDAARLGNFEFLRQLIRPYPYLVHVLDDGGKSIFHVAILHRQTDVFNLIHEIGFDKQLLAAYQDERNNNLLHYAAEYLSHGRAASNVPGAALEMHQELRIFKEVELLVWPSCKEMKNKEGQTPREVFTEKHTELLKEGEKWMKQTAKACSILAVLFASVVFEAALIAPDGDSNSTAFRIFSMANAIALSSSSISSLTFLYILTARYTESDFLWSVPLKLLIGFSMLLISIVAMMLAFSSIFLMALKNPRGRFPLTLTGIVFLSVPVSMWLLYKCFRDVLYLLFPSRFAIKPGGYLYGKTRQ